MTKRIVTAVGSALVAATAVFFFAPLYPSLSVWSRKNQKDILVISLQSPWARQAVEFSIFYTHSVNKGRVQDLCRLQKDRSILVHSSRFVSYGAGMSEIEDGGEFHSSDGFYEITQIDLTVPYIILAVGLISSHTIESNKKEIILADHFKAQTSVVIGARRISIFDYICAQGALYD